MTTNPIRVRSSVIDGFLLPLIQASPGINMDTFLRPRSFLNLVCCHVWWLVVVLCFVLAILLSTNRLFAQSTAPTPAVETHEVQAGETLSMIADSYGITLDELMTENGLTDANEIFIGQVLALPDGAQLQPTPSPLPRHIVQAGETLSQIAEQYDVTLTRLMLFNGISDANAVRVGQELRVPPVLTEETDENSTETNATRPTVATNTETATPVAPATATKEQKPTATVSSTATDTATTDEAIPTQSDDNAAAVQSGAGEIDEASALDLAMIANQIASLNRSYTIRTGDTLGQIALRAGVDQEALRRLNRLDEKDVGRLIAGETLLLPATGDDLRVRQPEQEYVVQAGDSLGTIATHFDLTIADLLAANRITDPDSISIGQHLTIPRPSSSETILASRETKVGPERNGFYYYTVQPGDTLSELARAFNSTKLALLEYNGLPDEQTVYAGLEIRIPFGPPALPDRRPPVPASGTSFLVSLSRQQCWLFHGSSVSESWTCSTGYGEWITRVGTFAVQSKIENAQSSAYRLDMPYWLGIYNVGEFENGIHGLPVDWDTGEKIWEGLIGEPATFGCAMLDDRDAAFLFTTAYIGMPIHVIH
ncbi:MAG: LysM peptidoglycan-binding domain-containing protein [Caldilineaceae bacterium]